MVSIERLPWICYIMTCCEHISDEYCSFCVCTIGALDQSSQFTTLRFKYYCWLNTMRKIGRYVGIRYPLIVNDSANSLRVILDLWHSRLFWATLKLCLRKWPRFLRTRSVNFALKTRISIFHPRSLHYRRMINDRSPLY
jgi:hypothetical protein